MSASVGNGPCHRLWRCVRRRGREGERTKTEMRVRKQADLNGYTAKQSQKESNSVYSRLTRHSRGTRPALSTTHRLTGEDRPDRASPHQRSATLGLTAGRVRSTTQQIFPTFGTTHVQSSIAREVAGVGRAPSQVPQDVRGVPRRAVRGDLHSAGASRRETCHVPIRAAYPPRHMSYAREKYPATCSLTRGGCRDQCFPRPEGTLGPPPSPRYVSGTIDMAWEAR